tara:strand:+ start:208 stop:576 length:369 start_codon:yes stop_codon:yes gene_type:complete
MANPNLLNITSIYGDTAYDANISTSDDAIITVAADKVVKINTLMVSNIDGVNAATITATVKDSGNSVLGYIAKTITVPPDSTLVLVSKDTTIYLKETQKLCLDASTSSDLSAVCSYEELDDA